MLPWIGGVYNDLGRHDDALRLKEETLALRKRILPADHPDIAWSMSNLASTYSELGRHEDALRLKEKELAYNYYKKHKKLLFHDSDEMNYTYLVNYLALFLSIIMQASN